MKGRFCFTNQLLMRSTKNLSLVEVAVSRIFLLFLSATAVIDALLCHLRTINTKRVVLLLFRSVLVLSI
mgnify:CR=1 FL=1